MERDSIPPAAAEKFLDLVLAQFTADPVERGVHGAAIDIEASAGVAHGFGPHADRGVVADMDRAHRVALIASVRPGK